MSDFTDYDIALFAQADLGEQARDFLKTDIGRYLTGCAEQQINDCSRELLKVLPSNTDKIQLLQNKAQTASNFIAWVQEAIDMGDAALQQVQQTEG